MFTRQSRLGGKAFSDDSSNLDLQFDEVYQGIVSSRGVRTDEEELALVNELIRRAEQGSFPEDGSMRIISPRADVDWASDEAMLAVQASPTRNYGLAAGGLLIACSVLFALFSTMGGNRGGGSRGNGGGSGGASAAFATSATATAAAIAIAASSMTATTGVNATQTAVAEATDVWAGSGIVVGSDYKQKLPPVYPETLEIDTIPFRVYPSAVDRGIWTYQTVEGTASWIGGTVINWSFGIPALDQNMALFNRLGQGRDVEGKGNGEKEALLRMSGGVVRHFRLQRPVQIERQQIEVFMQNQPGITVVLLGDEQGAKRWLIRGTEDYASSGYGADLDPGLESPLPTPSPERATSTVPATPQP